MKSKIMRILSVLPIFILVSACVSQAQTPKSLLKAPDWFLNQPKDDSTFRYFVGSGSSSKGDVAGAEKIAVQDIIDKIFFYIGVEVSSNTTAEAKASKDKFESDIQQVVKTQGQTRLSGFELMEKLPLEKGDNVTIYVLARYNKKELDARKAEIEKMFKEREEAISGPEKEGIDLADKGKYFQAVIKFIEAATAASTSKVANAEIKFKRNIDEAKEAVDKINLIKLNDNLEGHAGQKFSEPFKLKVTNGTSEDDPGVPGVLIEVTYKIVSKSGVSPKTTKVKTKENGMLEFDHPIPDFVGADTVKMTLNLESYTSALSDVPAQYSELVDSLESLIVGKKTVFAYKVSSNAKNIITGIVILDINVDGGPLSKTETGQSLLSALTEEKFKTKNLPLKPSELLDKGDFDIIEILTAKYSSDAERAIFGTARILSFSDNDDRKIAKCSGTVQVVDLKTKEILLTIVKDVNEMGKDENQAQSAAFKKLGKEIGKEIKNKLR